jgi:hypothetical protein
MPDMQQKDWAVELHMLCLLPSQPWVSAFRVAEQTERVAVLLGIVQELQLVQTVPVAWPMSAVVPTVLVWVVLPHCCTLERSADERELVAGKNKMQEDEVIRTLSEDTTLVYHKNKS